MNSKFLLILTGFLLLIGSMALALPPANAAGQPSDNASSRITDRDTWVDGNYLLMFVTNTGSIGYDQMATFGKNDGMYYPFISMDDLTSGVHNRTVVFAGGIWLGGVDATTGDTLVSVSEYSDDFWPGPMSGGTYDPDGNTDPSFRVYKLYQDSMASNPNTDYLEWPSDQGAPVDIFGNPKLTGKQTLWAVYNDANPNVHSNDASSQYGMNVEIQQTVWAVAEPGEDTLPPPDTFSVTQLGGSRAVVKIQIVEPLLMTGHDYEVIVDSLIDLGQVWHLLDVTLGDTVFASQTDFSGNTAADFDGMTIAVIDPGPGFASFEVVANAAGPIDPPEAGAFPWQGFPTPTGVDPNGNPTDGQQVGPAIWGLHTTDNGGSRGGGTRGSYKEFVYRVTANGAYLKDIGAYDYEIRFTGSYDNPDVNGSYALEVASLDGAMWVPFELWRTGINTPDDPSDDVRLAMIIRDYGGNGLYDLESWGCVNSNHGVQGEHSADTDDNDPFTDRVNWYLPSDDSPGESGYLAAVEAILNGSFDYGATRVLREFTIINLNGGVEPPFNQDLPEQGTIFRVTTGKEGMYDSFVFNATPPEAITTGPDGLSIYVKYKLINKGSKNLQDMFVSSWFDPDIGNAGDDLVGCDTLSDIFFCYNEGPDSHYGSRCPSFGGKLIEGPIVPSPGDSAIVDGQTIPGYKNLPMYSFQKYINGTDPGSERETYWYMNGLDMNGDPLPNGSHYEDPGDPVAGTGDLDDQAWDRRMMASFGPFDFAPNDTQQVILKFSVGRGSNELTSITRLKEILNSPPYMHNYIHKVTFSPDPIPMDSANSIDSSSVAYVTFGYSDNSFAGPAIDFSSFTISNVGVIDSIVVSPTEAGFVGEAARAYFKVAPFLSAYGAIWDTTILSYSVESQYVGNIPLSHIGYVTVSGRMHGDINYDGSVDIGDITLLVEYLFSRGVAPDPYESADFDSTGRVDIADLCAMVEHVFF